MLGRERKTSQSPGNARTQIEPPLLAIGILLPGEDAVGSVEKSRIAARASIDPRDRSGRVHAVCIGNHRRGAYQDPEFLRAYKERGKPIHVEEGRWLNSQLELIPTNEPTGSE